MNQPSTPLLLASDASLERRRRNEKVAKALLASASLISVLTLAVLLLQMLRDGSAAFDSGFWTQRFLPSGINTGNTGVMDSILATIITLVITVVFAVPVGTAAGIYLYEYAKPGRLTDWIRATVANLAGVPSVVYGLLGLAVFVFLFGLGSTFLTAGLTLGVLILPILIVSTEEALKTVPDTVRQASLALGATKWQTIRNHVLPYAMPSILTGNILALSRAAGETAPIIVIGMPSFATFLQYHPMASGTPLQLRAYTLAQDPRANAVELAGGAILVLLATTILLNLVAIVLRQRLSSKIKW